MKRGRPPRIPEQILEAKFKNGVYSGITLNEVIQKNIHYIELTVMKKCHKEDDPKFHEILVNICKEKSEAKNIDWKLYE